MRRLDAERLHRTAPATRPRASPHGNPRFGTYVYDHDTPEAFSGQDYFPDGMKRETFYRPADRGFEREIKKRLAYWRKLRAKAPGGSA